MNEKERLLLKLKDRWISGEISEEQYQKMKQELLAGGEESSGSATFDARATFQGIGIGSVLKDRYEITEELGRGGMGVVYKAKDRELDTIVAVKVLGEELARDGRSVRNLMEEAKISMRLAHPHIMRLINFESDDRRKFLVMEFIDGETLETRLARESKIAEPTLVQIASEICEGLGNAHKQKIIHRDIKPSNIMITASGEVKIMDFGIARVMKDSMTMVTGRMTTGTLIYMAPEQIEGRDVDGRSDLYSLGIMLYELAAGKPPFYQGDITHQHLKVSPKTLDGVSPRFNEIILKCLEKEKTKRFLSADELRAVLEGKQKTESEWAAKSAHEKAEQEAAGQERAAKEAAERKKAEREAASWEREQQLRIKMMGEKARQEEEKRRSEVYVNENTISESAKISADSSRPSRVKFRIRLKVVLGGILAFVILFLGYILLQQRIGVLNPKPEKDLLDSYFHAVAMNDMTTMSSIALEPVNVDAAKWNIPEASAEKIEPVILPDLAAQEQDFRKKWEQHAGPVMDAKDTLDTAKDELASARTGAARAAAQAKVNIAQKKFDEEYALHNELKKSYNDSKAAAQREEEITSFSLGVVQLNNIRDLRGEVHSKEIEIETIGKNATTMKLKVLIKFYDLKDEINNIAHKGRWVIIKFALTGLEKSKQSD